MHFSEDIAYTYIWEFQVVIDTGIVVGVRRKVCNEFAVNTVVERAVVERNIHIATIQNKYSSGACEIVVDKVGSYHFYSAAFRHKNCVRETRLLNFDSRDGERIVTRLTDQAQILRNDY